MVGTGGVHVRAEIPQELHVHKEGARISSSTYNALCAGIKEIRELSKTTKLHDAKPRQPVNQRGNNRYDVTPRRNFHSLFV